MRRDARCVCTCHPNPGRDRLKYDTTAYSGLISIQRVREKQKLARSAGWGPPYFLSVTYSTHDPHSSLCCGRVKGHVARHRGAAASHALLVPACGVPCMPYGVLSPRKRGWVVGLRAWSALYSTLCKHCGNPVCTLLCMEERRGACTWFILRDAEMVNPGVWIRYSTEGGGRERGEPGHQWVSASAQSQRARCLHDMLQLLEQPLSCTCTSIIPRCTKHYGCRTVYCTCTMCITLFICIDAYYTHISKRVRGTLMTMTMTMTISPSSQPQLWRFVDTFAGHHPIPSDQYEPAAISTSTLHP